MIVCDYIVMNKLSIRTKITVSFALSLLVISLVNFLLVRYISEIVLYNTARNFLLSSVNANENQIVYVQNESGLNNITDSDFTISYEDGYLAIDDDFLDIINNVHIALYSQDGTLIYGSNPIANKLRGKEFIGNNVIRKEYDNELYQIYERKVNVEGIDGLWLRGVMPLTVQENQLRDITLTAVFLLPILLVITSVVAYFLSSKMLKPIRNIDKLSSEITSGTDLKRRLYLKGPDDEIHQLASTIDNMISRLDEAFETEKQFTSDVSHELRTPMSVIIAQCEYILDKERDKEEYIDAIRTILKQGGRMNGLINDMLDYSRMDQKSKNYPLSHNNLSLLVNEVANEMKLLRHKNIKLSLDVEKDINVIGNRSLLIRLLQNIINNAYRYGKENGFIKVRLFSSNNQAVLQIEDNGIGIEEKALDHIFDRFYRAESSRTQKGTGLGLSMVKKIVDIHNGIIDVVSKVDKGTCFKIVFNKV